MRKKSVLFFGVLLLLINISNVFAITGAGSVDDSKKESIYNGYVKDGKIYKRTSQSQSSYSNIGGFYDSYITSDEKTGEEITSNAIYTDESLAKSACDKFISNDENKDKNYLCTGTVQKSGYACIINGTADLVSEDGEREYAGVNADSGEMYRTRAECQSSCLNLGGACKSQDGYKYTYTENQSQDDAGGEIRNIKGQYFITENNNYAFCIQPGKNFPTYNYSKKTGKMSEKNYCLDESFDLTTCNTATGYNSDYRCGLAYILLHAACLDENNTSCEEASMSINEYAVADVAMRMWAAYKGNLSGTSSTNGIPSSESEKNNTYFFGLTGKRAAQDSNYVSNGLTCSTDSKNIGIICNNGNTLYMKALKLYSDALNANKVDSTGSKVPTLITKNITSSTDTIEITKPCDPDEDGCTISMTLYDSNGNVVAEDDNATCSKSICTFKITGEKKTVCTENTLNYSAKITITGFKASGSVKSYYYCSSPNSYQIMYVLDATGEEATDTWTNTYTIKNDCSSTCSDSNLKKTVTSYNKNDSNSLNTTIESCDGNGVLSSDDSNSSSNYDGYDTILFEDPSMDTILSSSCKEKYRNSNYEVNTGGYCKIYCRQETKIELPDKTKVFSGMQFSYKLEEQIPNSSTSDTHISAIVRTTTECASIIDYDTWNEDYQNALKDMVDKWSDWKAYYELYKYYEDNSAKYTLYDLRCTAGCDYYESNPSKGYEDGCAHNTTGSITSGTRDYPNLVEYVAKINGRESHTTQVAGTCNPKATFVLNWPSRTANTYIYNNGSLSGSTRAASFSSGTRPVSGYSCSITFDGNFTYNSCVNKVSGSRYPCDGNYSCGLITVPVNGAGNTVDKCNESLAKAKETAKNSITIGEISNSTSTGIGYDGPYSCTEGSYGCNCTGTGKKKSCSRYSTYTTYSCNQEYHENLVDNVPDKCTLEATGTSCSEGENGDPQELIDKVSSARSAYNAAVSAVSGLLTNLQNCNLYNDWVPGDPSIQSYGIGINDGVGSTGGGGGAGGSGGGGGFSSEVGDSMGSTSTDKLTFDPADPASSVLYDEDGNKIEYNNEQLINNGSKNYLTIKLSTSTTNSVIKKKIINDQASTNDGNGIILDVEYDAGNGIGVGYGASSTYQKITNVIDDSSDGGVLNKYIGQSGVVKMVNCDLDKCYMVDTGVGIIDSYNNGVYNGNHVYFKLTTETLYYRNKNYYSEAYTGKVIELNGKPDDKKTYISLGNNVYPVYNTRTDSYDIKYTFRGLENANYYNKNSNNNYQIRNGEFEYSCSYDMYNETTQDTCESNETTCTYVSDTVPTIGNEIKNDKLCFECITGDQSSLGFSFRIVELNNLFPNNDSKEKGTNWQNSTKIVNGIESSSDSLFTSTEKLDLSVTLTPESIKEIREYNDTKNELSYGYQDLSLSNCKIVENSDGSGYMFTDCKSAFITDIAQDSNIYGVKVNEINRSSK